LARINLAYRLARVRELTDEYKAGTPQSFEAFRQLLIFLLNLTILDQNGTVTLSYPFGERDRAVLGGWGGPLDPLPLNDGRFLRLAITAYLEDTPHGPRLKVENAGYQYQADRDGENWIFRYDFSRNPANPYPEAHVQICGVPQEQELFDGVLLERVHFPTGRIPLEAVIRLLIQDFGVPSNEPADVWRPVLALSERLFLDIAHRPRFGPDQ